MKPIFSGEFHAFSAADAEVLTTLLARVARPGCTIAEVGSWLGTATSSTHAIMRAISGLAGARLVCVDTWTGSPGVERHADLVARYDALATFRANTAQFADRLDLMVCDSVRAAGMLNDGIFDLVFIDADHRYETVKTDIAAWRSKVRQGGILCGHDCEIRPQEELLATLEAGRDRDAILVPHQRFSAVHAGCVLAVHEAFDGRATLFSETTSSSIWAWDV